MYSNFPSSQYCNAPKLSYYCKITRSLSLFSSVNSLRTLVTNCEISRLFLFVTKFMLWCSHMFLKILLMFTKLIVIKWRLTDFFSDKVSYPLRRKLSRSTFTGVTGLCSDVWNACFDGVCFRLAGGTLCGRVFWATLIANVFETAPVAHLSRMETPACASRKGLGAGAQWSLVRGKLGFPTKICHSL